ncbi:hypothetical protein P7C71_g6539, partial [Lecanoromycetidae sp. Uapishka_2]
MSHVSHLVGSLLLLASWAAVYLLHIFGLLPAFNLVKLDSVRKPSSTPLDSPIDRLWNPTSLEDVNDIGTLINGSGVYGFIFNNSYSLVGNKYYGGYNYCNMPHVNSQGYVKAPEDYTLDYVEVIHRHHKRSPYATNTFLHDSYTWDCKDEGLFSYGKPLSPDGNSSASTYWSIYTSASNPFAPQRSNGTCQFPQITRGGLDDSWQHGKDLFSVYHDLLGFLPSEPSSEILYRVTNNVIASQVAGMIINAMFNSSSDFPLHLQPSTIDS